MEASDGGRQSFDLDSIRIVEDPILLSTRQKRLRHLTGIYARNLSPPIVQGEGTKFLGRFKLQSARSFAHSILDPGQWRVSSSSTPKSDSPSPTENEKSSFYGLGNMRYVRSANSVSIDGLTSIEPTGGPSPGDVGDGRRPDGTPIDTNQPAFGLSTHPSPTNSIPLTIVSGAGSGVGHASAIYGGVRSSRKLLANSFFTLNLKRNWSTKEPFYVSELFEDSLNPSWKYIDLEEYGCSAGVLAADGVIIQVWTASCASPSSFSLAVEWEVDFSGLEWLGGESSLSLFDFPANALLLRFGDDFFSYFPDKTGRNSSVETFWITGKSNLTWGCSMKTTLRLLELERTRAKLKLDIDKLLQRDISKLILHHVNLLESLVTQNASALSAERDRAITLGKSLDRRRNTYQTLVQLLQDQKIRKDQSALILKEKSEALLNTRSLMEKLVDDLIFQLQEIYPLQNIYDVRSIRGLSIQRNPSFLSSEQAATCFGYIAHLTLLIARYLTIPLRYPILPMGSRSMINDCVSRLSLQEIPWFPLYFKNQEQYRYDYAVYLLNKDIEQIVNYLNVGMKDVRNTLENLSLIYHYLSRRGLEGEHEATTTTPREIPNI